MSKKILTKIQKIDMDTGEIIKENAWVDVYRLIPYSRQRRYVKGFVSEIPKLSTRSYYGLWFLLSKRLEKNNNRIVRFEVNKVIPMGRKLIIEYLSTSDSTYRRFMRECVAGGFIAINTDTDEYYINPAYELNGNSISLELYEMFKGNVVMEKYITVEAKCVIDSYAEENLSITNTDIKQVSSLDFKIDSVVELKKAVKRKGGLLGNITSLSTGSDNDKN